MPAGYSFDILDITGPAFYSAELHLAVGELGF